MCSFLFEYVWTEGIVSSKRCRRHLRGDAASKFVAKVAKKESEKSYKYEQNHYSTDIIL